MTSGSRAETIVGTPEVIDGGEPLPSNIQHGDFAPLPALSARIATMADFPGLGPPDIVYVRKRFHPIVGSPKVYGYYHFIRGADVTSPAALSAYIYKLLNVGLDPAPWLASGSWEIIGASIHSYNAIAGRDAVVDIMLPGGIVASSVGPNGDVMPAVGATADGSDVFWKETHVCAVARAISNVGETPLYPCIRAVPPLPNPEAENDFLNIALSCVKRWHLSGTDRPSIEVATVSNSRIAVAIFDYFMMDARFARAQEFFDSDQILVADPEAGALAAFAAIRASNFDAADRIISTVLDLNPKASLAFLARSELLLTHGNVDGALEAALRATETQPDDLFTWIAVAKIQVLKENYDAALVALNAAEMPPPPLDPYLRQLVPNRKKQTTPERGGDVARSGAIRTLASRLREERNASIGKSDEVLAELPGKLMTKAERDVYAILVKICENIGWDGLLAVRGRCFVMESDISTIPSTGHEDLKSDTPIDRNIGESNPHRPQDHASSSGASRPNDISNGTTSFTASARHVEIDGNTVDSGMENISSGAATISIREVETIAPSEHGADVSHANAEDSVAGINANNGQDDEEEEESDTIDLRALGEIDLRAMAVWTAEEQMHRRSSTAVTRDMSAGEAAAAALREGGDIESGEDTLMPVRTADEIAGTTRRPPVDWLRRGDLALRLNKMEDAETAFLVCSKLSERAKIPSISALINLMNLAASEGQTGQTLRCADTIWSYVDVKTERQASQKTLDAYSEPAPVIRNAIHMLISKVGLSKVRNSMPSRMDINYSRMEGLLLDAVAWKVYRYDE